MANLVLLFGTPLVLSLRLRGNVLLVMVMMMMMLMICSDGSDDDGDDGDDI